MKTLFCLLAAACAVVFPPRACAAPAKQDDVAREFLWQQFRELPADARPRVGVALSGGGAKGFAHVGVLQILSDAGFPVDCLAGTSMGSVVGSMYCAGLPFEKIWEIGGAASFAKVSGDYNAVGMLELVLSQKLFSSEKMESFVNSYMGGKTFDQLKIPFSCSAMDLKTGENIVFREGPVAIAVRASMNIPGLFSPVQYRQRYLVDGGVADFLPVQSARDMGADWVLASVTLGDYSAAKFHSILSYVMQVMDIRGAILAEAAMKKADFVVEPHVSDISFVELNRCPQAGERGVLAMNENIASAEESLIFFSINEIASQYNK
ncbi:MAG: patatin-like phospholipase family protein [Elusimicrobiales bacterium]